jgi:cysteine synthase
MKSVPSLHKAEKVMQTILQRLKPDYVTMRSQTNVTAILGRPSKIYAAYGAIWHALRTGSLRPGQPVADVSSGTQALSLAIFCQAIGLELILVVDRWCSSSLQFQLSLFGAKIVFAEEYPGLGSQANRLRVLREVHRRTGAYYLNQYDSSCHAAGYCILALDLLERGLNPDVMVFTVGSGASSLGLLESLRLLKPQIAGVGIDVLGSVPFGQKDEPPLRTVGGIGNSILPRAIRHDVYDAIHFVSGAFARATTRRLLQLEGLWRGESSGPAAHVAMYYARQYPGKQIAFLSPDGGERYQTGVWNPELPPSEVLSLNQIAAKPEEISHPHESKGHWCYIDWRKRTYEEVVGRPPDPAFYRRLENEKEKV